MMPLSRFTHRLILMMVCSLSGIQLTHAALTPCEDFGAYYTKLDTGADFEKYYRAGEFTDVVVDMGKDNGQLIFWRGTSYLPMWKTAKGEWMLDELIKRKGDGPKKRPDKVNLFSVVKIIESNNEQVVIHWRYLPEFGDGNPKTGVASTKFVDEYFYIQPDGSIKRTLKKGTTKLLDWVDPDNISVYEFNLKLNGISKASVKKGKASGKDKKVEGNAIVSKVAIDPVAWWKFDEGMGDMAKESVKGQKRDIAGGKSLWRQGVSGTALQFDGYKTKIELPAKHAPKIKSAITLEGWAVLGSYPWNWVPIVQQSTDVPEEIEQFRRELEEGEDPDDAYSVQYKYEDDHGYFLGINGDGFAGMKIRVGGKWEELTANTFMERRQWYHIVGTYDKKTGKMSIYVDGQLSGQKTVAKTNIETASDKPLKIGQGKMRRQINPVRENTFPGQYSFDGLIDEVRIYDSALSDGQVAANYSAYRKIAVDMDKRVLPAGKNTGEFGAYYTHLKFYDVWDNLWRFGDHPDVVVEFADSPAKFVFWRGVSFITMMVNDKAQWYSNEFNETWETSGGAGCQEPMSDKQSWHNHAKIIENTPARSVVQWRFPLVDVQHVMANYDEESGWCDWSEWTYYIYPDGVAAKYMQLFTHGNRNHEWQESMAIFGPDQHPEQIIETKGAVTMVTLDGEYKTYDWVNGPPPSVDEPAGACIQYINYTGEYDPVTITDPFEGTNVYGGELTPYAVFPTWNHWPVAQLPSDGRYASFPDRTSHSSLTHVYPPIYEYVVDDPVPFYSKIMLEGMLKTKPLELVDLAKSWQYAPKISNLTGFQGIGYDRAQRAYIFKVMKPEEDGDELARAELEEEGEDEGEDEGDEEEEHDEQGDDDEGEEEDEEEEDSQALGFRVNASKTFPFVNGCFVLKDWNNKDDVSIWVDDTLVDIKQGNVRNTRGQWDKLIWLEKTASKPFTVTFELQ